MVEKQVAVIDQEEFFFLNVTYCCEFVPHRRANDRVYPIAAALPTERAIQSRPSGSTPETGHGCVF